MSVPIYGPQGRGIKACPFACEAHNALKSKDQGTTNTCVYVFTFPSMQHATHGGLQ